MKSPTVDTALDYAQEQGWYLPFNKLLWMKREFGAFLEICVKDKGGICVDSLNAMTDHLQEMQDFLCRRFERFQEK